VIQTHLVAALVAALVGFGSAWQVQDWRFGAAERDRIEAAQEVERLRAAQADAASSAHEQERAENRAKFRVIYKDVERVVEKPVYRDRECFDSDGLRILSEAISGGAGNAASEPAPAVP
jgi:predicted metalloprotease